MSEQSIQSVYKIIGYMNTTLSCVIICTIVFWIVKVVQYAKKCKRELDLVRSHPTDVVQKRELINKRTDYHRGVLLLTILFLELTQKLTAVVTYGVINMHHVNISASQPSNACLSVSLTELYSVMRHTPAVLVLRAVSNSAILGMLSCVLLTLVYLTNAYGERGDRRNFRNFCVYAVIHCMLVLLLSCVAHTWLVGYFIYDVLSVVDFILIARYSRELYRVLVGRTREAMLEFDSNNLRYHYIIQKRYRIVVSGVLVCLSLFVFAVFVQRISIVFSVLTDYPCFLYQSYRIPIYLFLSENGRNVVKIVSHCMLVSFYVLILIFDFLFAFLNLAAIILHVFPKCGYFHSNKEIRNGVEPLLQRYHKSIRTW